jgi:hypothetical protein
VGRSKTQNNNNLAPFNKILESVHNLLNSDRKQVSGFLDLESGMAERLTMEYQQTVLGDSYIHCLQCSKIFISSYICQNLLINIFTVYYVLIIPQQNYF